MVSLVHIFFLPLASPGTNMTHPITPQHLPPKYLYLNWECSLRPLAEAPLHLWTVIILALTSVKTLFSYFVCNQTPDGR